MDGNDGQGNSGERLLSDLTGVIRDAQQLMRAGGHQAGENYDAALARFVSTLDTAKDSLIELEQKMVHGAREALDTTDRYVQQHPWQSVGIGALAGLALGVLIGRR